jgi:hypothetical protein
MRPVPPLATSLAMLASMSAIALLLGGCSADAGATMAVDGRIDLGPMCPVEREGSACPVPPEAFAGAEVVARQGEAEERAPVGADGTFTLSLAEGTWEVTATAGMSCAPVTVQAAGSVVITCDTGIR